MSAEKQHIEDIDESGPDLKLRSPQEIVERLLCCTISAVGGDTGDKNLVKELLTDFEVEKYLSPLEKEFLTNRMDDKHEQIQFSWHYERAWVLLWALGYIGELPYPSAQWDGNIAEFITGKSIAQLVDGAKPRAMSEVLDANEVIYNLHWAVRDAQLNNKPVPKNLDGGVVMERHHALNWLIGYSGGDYRAQDWDDITTDT